ncbi:MAG: glycosyltransferase family A protein [Candidatus Delongbacteria bacterium]
MELSVVIAAYNGEQSLGRTLDSLCAALPADSEVVVVDDGSTDGTAQLVRERGDARLQLVQQANQGPAVAANSGLVVARGRFVARLDCGDLCHPERLALQLDHLRAHPELLLTGCRVRRLDAQGRVLGESEVVRDPARLRRGLMRLNLFQHSSVMIRRDALSAVGGYRPFFRFSLDLDLFLRLSERGPLDNLPQTLSDWVMEPDSISFKYRGAQARFAELSRQSAAARRRGEPDPLDAGLLTAPALLPEPAEQRLAHYHLEVARALLMGGRGPEARAELALARSHGLSAGVARRLAAFSRLPGPLRSVLRRARVAWVTR